MSRLAKISEVVLVSCVFLGGLLLRFYRIEAPVADWHSHRQADTASVTREYIKQGVNFLVPKYHDLSNVQSGIDNPQGFRMVEAPLYNIMGVGAAKVTGNLEVGMRLLSIGLSLVSAVLIFLLSFQLTRNKTASFLGAGIFWLMPFNIYYSRAILPESLAVATMLASLYFFRNQTILSAAFMAVSILTKPYTAILSAPLMAWWAWEDLKKNKKIKSVLKYFIFGVIALVPFGIWRWWISRFPEGIPSSAWLFNDSDKAIFPAWWHGMNMVWLNKMVAFRPSWFRWLVIERVTKLIAGIYGVLPLYLGLAYKKGKNQAVGVAMIVGIFFYFVIVAGGNLRHDYYQVLIIPFLSLIMGWGAYYLGNFVFGNKTIGTIGLVLVLAMAWYTGWDQVKDYYKINNLNIIEAGTKADEILPKDALVVAPYMGDTAFLYQTNRQGWPTEIYNVEDTRKLVPGKKVYLVSVNYDDYTNGMMRKYESIYKNEKFIILDLNHEK